MWYDVLTIHTCLWGAAGLVAYFGLADVFLAARE